MPDVMWKRKPQILPSRSALRCVKACRRMVLRTPATVALGLLAALAAVAATPAAAWELKLWPLFDIRHETGDTAIDLLGPLISTRQSPEGYEITVRPLFHWQQSADEDRGDVSLLYPLASVSWTPERTEYRLLFFASVRHRTASRAEPERRDIVLPPFFLYRSDGEDASLWAWPLFADASLLGYDRIRFVLFPLFLRTERGEQTRSWLPYPIVSWSESENGRGASLWPLAGWHYGGEAQHRFALWPIYVDEQRTVGDDVAHRLSLPAPSTGRSMRPTSAAVATWASARRSITSTGVSGGISLIPCGEPNGISTTTC